MVKTNFQETYICAISIIKMMKDSKEISSSRSYPLEVQVRAKPQALFCLFEKFRCQMECFPKQGCAWGEKEEK